MNNNRQVISYLTKRCPKYHYDLIEIGKKGSGYQYPVILIVGGKLHRITIYGTEHELDCLVPRLNEYFETGVFETATYHEYYDNSDISAVAGRIFRFDTKEAMWAHVKIVRETYPNCGIREVPKPLDGNFV